MSDASSPEFFDQRKIIDQVLEEICPIDVELLGPTTLDEILAGAEFKPVQGGRHFELGTTIALVGCICSLTQLGIKLWELQRAGSSQPPAAPAGSEHEVHVGLSEHIAQQPEIAQVLSENSLSPARVVQTIELVLKTNFAKSDRAK